ncbi:MAG TPA: maleylpyruvate isomerase family mycothiol-dependent enzyme [Pseudonocardiaceae bacterium]|nr:maleylpyruvate isomerase family mycothiol-dependent enzyme [Pseudonocardiaceae bacterium]
MAPLADGRYLEALPAQAVLFAEALEGADLQQVVPTCPEWTLYQLTEHLGKAHRWACAIVSQRSTAPPDPRELAAAPPPDDSATLLSWVRDGARELAEAVRATGPQTHVWSWTDDQRAGFWARRMTHETAVHRADAELAQGRPFTLEPDLAADAISEWLQIICSAQARAARPELAELCGDGQLLHLHSLDPGLGEAGEWIVRRTPSGPVWEHGHAKGDVAVRGTAVDLLLVMLRRVPPDEAPVQVLGDPAVLAHWLAHTGF